MEEWHAICEEREDGFRAIAVRQEAECVEIQVAKVFQGGGDDGSVVGGHFGGDCIGFIFDLKDLGSVFCCTCFWCSHFSRDIVAWNDESCVACCCELIR